MVSTKIKGLAALIGLISVVWGLFLTYKILIHIQATELMWFVYWTYVPIIIVTMFCMELIKKD